MQSSIERKIESVHQLVVRSMYIKFTKISCYSAPCNRIKTRLREMYISLFYLLYLFAHNLLAPTLRSRSSNHGGRTHQLKLLDRALTASIHGEDHHDRRTTDACVRARESKCVSRGRYDPIRMIERGPLTYTASHLLSPRD